MKSKEGLQQTLQDRDSLVLMEAFIREFGIAHHQLQSFNDFVERDIATLEDVIIDPVPLNISGEGKTLHFRFGQVSFKPPVLVDDDNRVTKMLTPKKHLCSDLIKND